jgi:transcription elongation factor Elf1
MKNLVRDYYNNHVACPKCNSMNLEETTWGFILLTKNCKDYNKVLCITCGFSGIVHDLVPLKKESNECSSSQNQS